MKIPRVENLRKDLFINDYLLPKIPVIVTDAMEGWDMEKFSPEYLKESFGAQDVQVYNDLFELQTIESLAEYLERNFGGNANEAEDCEYIRWYTKFKEIDFYWSDEVFSELKAYWHHPYFVPNSAMAIPFCASEEQRNIHEESFPYKGLFISGKGSRTRLHKDPLDSNAILCQFYGEKKMLLFHPRKEAYLMKGAEFVDLKNIDHDKYPQAADIKPDYEDVLKPGEIVFFPSGWFHDVSCISDSISITWNFVHSSESERLYNHISQNPMDKQLDVVRYFLNERISQNADISEILNFYKSNQVVQR